MRELKLQVSYDDIKFKGAKLHVGNYEKIAINFPHSKYEPGSSVYCVDCKDLTSEDEKEYPANYNIVLANEQKFEMAVALSDNDPTKVEGWNDFKYGGKHYNTLKWYNNYRDKTVKENLININSPFLLTKDYRLYNTPTGRKIAEELAINPNPSEEQIRKMLIEAGRIVEVTDTELGELSVGNFDYLFDSYKIRVLVRLKFQFNDKIPKTKHQAIKNRLLEGVSKYWHDAHYGINTDNPTLSSNIPIYIYIQEVLDDYHKIVDVDFTTPSPENREVVIRDMNVLPSTSMETFAHEFGHVLGLYDEYKSSNEFEQHMFWKDNKYNDDVKALMNSGSELRPRYFEHYIKPLKEKYKNYSFNIEG